MCDIPPGVSVLLAQCPSMPPGSSQWVIGDVGQREYNHPHLVSTLTIGPEIPVSFGDMFINYGEHLRGAETIPPAREVIRYGYKHAGLFRVLDMDEYPSPDVYLALQCLAFCLYC